jgi:hypothetical protein
MKKVFIALTAIITMASCKKENVVIPAAPAETKVLAKASYVWDNGTPETSEYTYDTQGKVSIIKEDNRTYSFSFVSASSLVVVEKNNTDNSLYRTYECALNDKGYITKMVMKNPAGAVTFTYEYNYNADGYMSAKKGIYPNGNTLDVIYTYADGNLDSYKLYYDNVFNSQTKYMYDKTKVNKIPMGSGGYWNIIQFWGKGSKNLAAEINISNTSGSITWQRQYAFELDAAGYVTKITGTDMFSGKKSIDTYTYQ